jgi:C4-dicarboxylate-specific signal transduction histidine kinase
MKFKLLFIIFLLIVASIIITLNVFFLQNYEAEMAMQFSQQQLIIAKTVAESIQNNLEHLKEETIALAELLSRRGLKKEGLEEFINYALAELQEEIGIKLVILDRNEKVVYSSSDNALRLIKKSMFERARELGIKKFHIGYSNVDKRILTLIVPIRRGEEFKGSLVLFVSVDDINTKFLAPIKAGKRGYAWMMDSSGTLIYHPTQKKMVGRNIFKADSHCFKCHKSFKTEIEILKARDIGYSSYIAPYGEDKLVAFSRVKLENLNWIVCVSMPYSEVTSSIQRSMRFHSLMVLTILVITVTGALIVIIINRERVKAEEKARYTEKIREYAAELENIVRERTKELKEEKEKLHAIVSSVNAGICIFNEQRRLVWLNKVLEEWLSDDKLKDFTIDSIYQDSKVITALCNAVINDKNIQEVLYLDLGKRKGYFQVSATPLKTSDGRCNILILLQDVTELKMAEQQLMQSEKLAALARLSAGVAHEIGNPLTSISSYIQILQEMDFDEFTKDAINTIAKHIKRISSIVRQMSSFSKTHAEEIKRVKIKELVNSTLELVKYDKRMKNVEVHIDIPDDIPDILVDENQMEQVFINLELNSLDAMPQGGHLTISARRLNSDVEIVFSDTGIGIPEEHLSRIFDPFFTTKDKGTGLGLAVSYSIVRSFGGNIVVESTPGKGSTFRIRLPAYERK